MLDNYIYCYYYCLRNYVDDTGIYAITFRMLHEWKHTWSIVQDAGVYTKKKNLKDVGVYIPGKKLDNKEANNTCDIFIYLEVPLRKQNRVIW